MPAKKKPAEKQSTKSNTINHIVKDCTFVGVQVDAEAAEVIKPIAEGLLETAKGLGALAKLLSGSKINFESMLKIGSD